MVKPRANRKAENVMVFYLACNALLHIPPTDKHRATLNCPAHSTNICLLSSHPLQNTYTVWAQRRLAILQHAVYTYTASTVLATLIVANLHA